uniref:Uncharacterized protein n=1 Tax=Coccidioides posadasii RMSCC 3488 TaxID=454284 RepID=A0A0J6ILL3_COCPO|nr:hypothetical protein CPAG_09099 [Coccidioides posadasii RMSCC 3488]
MAEKQTVGVRQQRRETVWSNILEDFRNGHLVLQRPLSNHPPLHVYVIPNGSDMIVPFPSDGPRGRQAVQVPIERCTDRGRQTRLEEDPSGRPSSVSLTTADSAEERSGECPAVPAVPAAPAQPST